MLFGQALEEFLARIGAPFPFLVRNCPTRKELFHL